MENSKIEWTQDTWNPWYGCQKVSTGCKYCYMYRDQKKYGGDPEIVMRSKSKFDYPIKVKESRLIFTCSWSDWFIDKADKWRDEAWEVIRNTPQHTYQILTKRPERILENLPDGFENLNNVWLGASVESEQQVDRLDYLVDLPCTTFASFEPLIGPVQWNANMSALDWCIVGGESGNDNGKYQFRPMELKWAVDLVKNARENGVACFVKQLGTYQYGKLEMTDRYGGKIEEFPENLRVREFPM